MLLACAEWTPWRAVRSVLQERDDGDSGRRSDYQDASDSGADEYLLQLIDDGLLVHDRQDARSSAVRRSRGCARSAGGACARRVADLYDAGALGDRVARAEALLAELPGASGYHDE